MAQKLDVNLPPDLDLDGGWTLRVTAVDSSGALVPNVNVTNMAIVADSPTSSTGQELQAGPFMLVPGPETTTGQPSEPTPPPPAPLPPSPSPAPEPPPTAPPPAATGGAWAWDATAAEVKGESAAMVSAFLQYGGPFAYFSAEVGAGIIDKGTATYTVSSVGKPGGPFDPVIYVPGGVKPGVSHDHHLTIIDNVRKRWHDFELYGDPIPTKYWADGKLVGWTGGDSMAAGAVQEPTFSGGHGGATAARFPLVRGLVTLDEAKTGVINHALVFTCTNVGPSPNPYPANSPNGYTSPNRAMPLDAFKHMPPLGQWLRLAPDTDLGSLRGFERVLGEALKRYGMFCRDRGTDFALHGMDVGGGGSSFQAWREAGVNLNANGVLILSSAFKSVLRSLQALVPPSR